MIKSDQFVLYGGIGNHEFHLRVVDLVNEAERAGLHFFHLDHRDYPDGEPNFVMEGHKNIEGRHVIVFACPIDDYLENEMRDLITAAKRQYGARSVTVVLTSLRYRRQDRIKKEFEITRLRWFMSDLRDFGADQLVLCEPHSEEHTRRYAEEFGLRLFIADPTSLYVDALRPLVQTYGPPSDWRVLSPDMGSVSRALSLARAFGMRVFAIPKMRVDGGDSRIVRDDHFLEAIRQEHGADVEVDCDRTVIKDKHVLLREDEVATGGTSVNAADNIRAAGAKTVHFAVTFSVCTLGWKDKLLPLSGRPWPFETIWFGNIRPRGNGLRGSYPESTGDKIRHVDMAPCIARALIEAIHKLP